MLNAGPEIQIFSSVCLFAFNETHIKGFLTILNYIIVIDYFRFGKPIMFLYFIYNIATY
jgi:hypothetical protein